MINPEGDQSRQETKSTKTRKKPLHSVLFWFFLFSSTILSLQQYITYLSDVGQWVSFGLTIASTIPTYVVVCCWYAESKWELFKLFILIDNFFACWVVALFGLIGINSAFTVENIH